MDKMGLGTCEGATMNRSHKTEARFTYHSEPPTRCRKCGRPIHSNQSKITGICGLCAQDLPDNGGDAP